MITDVFGLFRLKPEERVQAANQASDLTGRCSNVSCTCLATTLTPI